MEAVVEKSAKKANGYIFLIALLFLLALEIWGIVIVATTENPSLLWFIIPAIFITAFCLGGLMIIQPNESRVLILFGKYIGTVRDSRFW